MQGRVYFTRLSRPLERIKPRPADRRKEIRDKKLVGMKPHRLVVRLPDGRSGGARRKPLPNCRLQDTYSSTGA